MRFLIVTIAMSVGGGLGWWLGAKVGIFTALVLANIGTGVGIYVSRKWIRENLGA